MVAKRPVARCQSCFADPDALARIAIVFVTVKLVWWSATPSGKSCSTRISVTSQATQTSGDEPLRLDEGARGGSFRSFRVYFLTRYSCTCYAV